MMANLSHRQRMADTTPPTMYHCVNASKPRRTREAQTLALTTHLVSLLIRYCSRAGREAGVPRPIATVVMVRVATGCQARRVWRAL